MDWAMKHAARSPLLVLALFAFVLALGGPSLWPQVTIAYVLYRIVSSRLFHRICATLPRDLRGLALLLRVKMDIRARLRADAPLHEIFLESVRRHPNKEAVVEIETDRVLSFQDLNYLCNRYANFFQCEGYGNGDVVSLFLHNGVDFFALWLGLSKLGVITAWINCNLKLEPLAHSVEVAKTNSIVTSRALLPALKKAFEKGLLPRLKIFIVDEMDSNGEEVIALKEKLQTVSYNEPIPNSKVTFKSVLSYIYTSGTTGNPKPAVIKHFRFYWMSMGVAKSFGIYPQDRVYVTMPMYHSAAGILGIGQCVIQGCTLIIRRKFSGSHFWTDCVEHQCTVSQYIGEICRYLLAQKVIPEEKEHNVRLMFGNGLRGEIWAEFVARFRLQSIGEFYGSTEGNSNIVNIDGHVGACGFFPIYRFLTRVYPLRILKINEETGEFVRDERGLCVPCRPGDTGEMVGVIKEKDPLLRFEGYVGDDETSKKIVRSALCKGDAVFSSGDVIHWDEYGYLFFKDRRGDTFRWKGENVSTTEVEGILQPIKEVADVTVYGVEIPRKEGRAGMAAVVLSNGVSVDKIIEDISVRLSDSLPPYAIPLFVRLCKKADLTATFKLKKTNLQKEGFDLERCRGDILFFWDSASKLYRLMDSQLQRSILEGTCSRI